MSTRPPQDEPSGARDIRLTERFDQAVLPMAIIALDGTVLEVNGALCRLLGRPRDGVVGQQGTTFTADGDASRTGKAIVAAVRAGEVGGVYEDRVRAADGAVHVVQVAWTVMRDDTGDCTYLTLVLLDVTERREQEARLAQSEARFRARFELSALAQAMMSLDGVLTAANRAFATLIGRPVEQLVGAPLTAIIHPHDGGLGDLPLARVLAGEQDSAQYERTYADADGRPVPALVDITLLRDADGRPDEVAALVHDLRAVRDLESRREYQEQLFLALGSRANDVALVTDADGQILYASPATEHMFGYRAEEVVLLDGWSFVHPADVEGARASYDDVVRNGGTGRFELRVRDASGQWRWVEETVTNLFDTSIGGVVANLRDVTDRVRAEEQLRRAALHDGLTGLPNRTLLHDRLEQALARSREGAGVVAVLYLDLDAFALVNDAHGAGFGDAVLAAVAERLRGCASAADTVARFGGDEFVVVCEGGDEAGVRGFAETLLGEIKRPLDVGGRTVELGASMGLAVSPAGSAEDLLRFAATAMRAAKAAGRGRVTVFDPVLAEEGERRRTLATDLRVALADDRLRLHYQPVIELSGGRVVGMEALARWNHPERGEVPPAQFVEVAEQSAMAVELDTWSLRRATREAADLRRRGVVEEHLWVGVNLSARSLADPDLEAVVLAAAHDAGLPPHQVVLEITESAVMDDAEQAVRLLGRLREHGFGVAVDDFGTGYSSLAYLRDLPITSIKIDRSFVAGIVEDRDALAIAASIVDLAHAIDVTTVAEGVETKEQAALLRRLGCDTAQGWLWSPALPPEQLPEASATWRAGYPVERAATGKAPTAADRGWLLLPEHGSLRLLELHREGASLSTVAAALNSEGFRTPTGTRWHRTTVARAVAEAAYPELVTPERPAP